LGSWLILALGSNPSLAHWLIGSYPSRGMNEPANEPVSAQSDEPAHL